jgi:hypothetical protein
LAIRLVVGGGRLRGSYRSIRFAHPYACCPRRRSSWGVAGWLAGLLAGRRGRRGPRAPGGHVLRMIDQSSSRRGGLHAWPAGV